ncbi:MULTISPECIES: lysophospholipid acyltransferase family protein [Methylotenera]|uniref:lysophospholipid acyltransferase family protein n=1 Tax=Methylotenera TaxID=359407 RepID=UPI00037AB2D8|nr:MULTISPECIES: lysophospholipid acyltransferase family protein [Methylotenera]
MLNFIFNTILNAVFKFFGILSLPSLHRLGVVLGWLIYWCMPKSSITIKNNIKTSGLAKGAQQFKQILNANIGESGKAVFETIGIWQKKETDILGLVRQVHGWQTVKDALQLGKGIIFLTPHLGCFEITSIYYGSKHPITVLYRPPKLQLLHNFILQGRTRKGVTLAEASASGVRKLMQALKRNEAIGILPDQIPAAGEGEWADFFGKQAYTMTLASKLAEKTGATVIMAFGERLANGTGFDIHITRLESIATTTLLNNAIEQQIALNPAQYLWRYDRYKQRRHAMEKREAPATTAELKSKSTKNPSE